MSHTVESALGDVRLETLSSGSWGLALAVALVAHILLAAGYAAWERTRALNASAENEVRIDVQLGPPGGRIEPEPPPVASTVPAPPETVAQPSRTERAADAPPITPTAPPPPAPPDAALSSALSEGGSGPVAPVVEETPPTPPPPIDPEVLKAYVNRAVSLISDFVIYPPFALRNQLEGLAVLVLTVDRRGRLLKLRMVDGTDHELLDEAIMTATRKVPNFGRLPDSYAGSALSFRATIHFILVD